MNKLLLDTNLLVYAVDHASEFHTPTVELIDREDQELYTTTKNISEFLVATTRGDTPLLTTEQALDEIDRFEFIMRIIAPTDSSFDRFKKVLRDYQPRGKKVHDYEIAAIALSHGIGQIATFNESDFSKIREITCVTPDSAE